MWQPRHYVLFARLVAEYPFGLTRPQLRRTFDRAFPQFSGYSFAGAMRALENARVIEVCEGDGCPCVWATAPAVEAWKLREVISG